MKIRNLKLGRKQKAETLLEVVIAIMVVAMGAAVAASVIVTALRSNSFNRDSLMAQNLAQEGIEYMRNLRDTNWMKFSYDPEGCWNMKPGVDSCITSDALISKYYSLGDKLSSPYENDLDLSSSGNENYHMYCYKLRGSTTNDCNLMLSYYSDESSGTSTFIKGKTSQFYRSVSIEYYTMGDSASDYELTACLSNCPANANVMLITSKVEWQSPERVNAVKLQSILTKNR
jgi:type II secretory pathway pseudopilin PulG